MMLFKHALRKRYTSCCNISWATACLYSNRKFCCGKIFTIPGLGSEFISSIINRDYTMIMGTTIFLAALIIIMNLLVDIAYKIVDPRIQFK